VLWCMQVNAGNTGGKVGKNSSITRITDTPFISPPPPPRTAREAQHPALVSDDVYVEESQVRSNSQPHPFAQVTDVAVHEVESGLGVIVELDY
jgi:hypothetical protein